MKKIVILLAALSLAAVSCKKVSTDNTPQAVITTGSEAAVASVTLSGKLGAALESKDVTAVGFLVGGDADMKKSVKEFSATLKEDETFSAKVNLDEFEGKRGVTYYYRAYAESSDGRQTGKVKSFQLDLVAPTGLTLTVSSVGVEMGKTIQLTATVTPKEAAADNVVKWSSKDKGIATVSETGLVTGVAKGKTTITASCGDFKETCAVTVRNVKPAGAVDLGLDVYWAECNLSDNGFVSSPEKYGDYYAWGETRSKSTYTESNYLYKDNPKTLPLTADAAHAILGGNWRMPTKDEFQTLLDNCTVDWPTTRNGVRGGLFTSKINGKSIFLPAAGHIFSSGIDEVGTMGFYWSSSNNSIYSAYSLWLVSWGEAVDDRDQRYYGQSIRPVSD